MSLHKLSAGDGYTYLIRQVAASDATERGHSSLGDYYSAKGETPGVWTGNGLAALGISGQVTEEQMTLLFGEGRHPDAARIADEILTSDKVLGDKAKAIERATQLGRPFYLYEGSSEWRQNLGEAYQAFNTVRDLQVNAQIPDEDRARIRTDVASAMFTEEHGRAPFSEQEFSSYLARISRPTSTAVAGYDLTFSPVKSVSSLWAVADRDTAAAVRAGHEAAVAATLGWIEQECSFTREGPNGVAQVPVRGLIIAQFTHRDARSGEPDLHTHAAVSNKVQTLDGRWMALDGRTFHKYAVAASEFYNNQIETELVTRLGVRFAALDRSDGKRQVREIAGVDRALNDRWSSLRHAIEQQSAVLSRQFVTGHGRLPTPVEALKLAQQATLDTRAAKHEPRSEREQRETWRAEADQVLGPHGVTRLLARIASAEPYRPLDDDLITAVTGRAAATVAEHRATWQHAHVLSEARRQARFVGVHPNDIPQLEQRIVTGVLAASTAIRAQIEPDDVTVPTVLTPHPDGRSVFSQKGAQLYTSTAVMAAEHRILATAARTDGRVATDLDVDLALAEWTANHHGRTLNHAQTDLVRAMATSGHRVELALAPAGTGKTTALGVLATAWTNSGGTVVGLSPQAAPAQELSIALGGADTDTLDKLVWEFTHRPAKWWPDWVRRIGPGSLVIVDEAGLASTPKLDAAIHWLTHRGASVRLIGDDQQFAATGAGGVLRDIAAEHGALALTEVVRFADPAEAVASLGLRDGDVSALGYYLDRGLVHGSSPDTVLDDTYRLWSAAVAEGKLAMMSAPLLEQTAALNTRSRIDRLAAAGGVTGREVSLGGRETGSAGDVIITKSNDRRLSLGGTDYVKNGDRWTITKVRRDGSIDARHLTRPKSVRLPAEYVAEYVRLGYADTRRSVIGRTVGDRGRIEGINFTITTAEDDRQTFYTAMTRAINGNHAIVVMGATGDEHAVTRPESICPPTAADLLSQVLLHDGSARSAHTEIRNSKDPLRTLGHAADAYLHSIRTAATTYLGADRIAQLTVAAEVAVPGVIDSPAWDTLLAHLALLTLDGHDAIAALTGAAAHRELKTAGDLAAVLDWRLDPNGNHSQQPGPLPWLPAIPTALTATPEWADYLRTREILVTDRASATRDLALAWTPTDAPAWALPYLDNPRLLTDLTVWRAATSTPAQDLRPGGDRPHTITRRATHARLTDRAIAHAGNAHDGMQRWASQLERLGAVVGGDKDPQWPIVAARLSTADAVGIDVIAALTAALHDQPALPAEHPSSALWHRLNIQLPTVTTATRATHQLRPAWTDQVNQALGDQIADRIMQDRLWPVIVSRVDTAERHGQHADRLMRDAASMLAATTEHLAPRQLATGLMWHLTLLTEPAREPAGPRMPDPADDDVQPADDADQLDFDDARDLAAWTVGADDDQPADPEPPYDPEEPVEAFAAAGSPGTPNPSAPDERPTAAGGNTVAGTTSRLPHSASTATKHDLERELEALTAAHGFYLAAAKSSWVPDYLASRALPELEAGYAPAGWTDLTDHLRGLGFTNQHLVDAGLAARARTNPDRIYDRFRDRLILPITRPDGQVVSFIGRAVTDAGKDVPKYINGPTTHHYRKAELPYGLNPATVAQLRTGADAVIVEGPLDVAAVRAARPDLAVIAPAGTALTADHLTAVDSVAPLAARTVYAVFDADANNAGQTAAIRAYGLLQAHGIRSPQTVTLPIDTDPASLLVTNGRQELAAAFDQHVPLLDLVVDHQITRELGPDYTKQNPSIQWQLQHNAMHVALETTVTGPGGLPPHPADLARQRARIADQLPAVHPHTLLTATEYHLFGDTVTDGSTPNSRTVPGAKQDWRSTLASIRPDLPDDRDAEQLVSSLRRLDAYGLDPHTVLVELANADGALPADHAARELLYRLDDRYPQSADMQAGPPSPKAANESKTELQLQRHLRAGTSTATRRSLER